MLGKIKDVQGRLKLDGIDTEFNRRLVFDVSIAGTLLAAIALLGFVMARGMLRQVGGEQGHGFAVVADEVRKLVSRFRC